VQAWDNNDGQVSWTVRRDHRAGNMTLLCGRLPGNRQENACNLALLQQASGAPGTSIPQGAAPEARRYSVRDSQNTRSLVTIPAGKGKGMEAAIATNTAELPVQRELPGVGRGRGPDGKGCDVERHSPKLNQECDTEGRIEPTAEPNGFIWRVPDAHAEYVV